MCIVGGKSLSARLVALMLGRVRILIVESSGTNPSTEPPSEVCDCKHAQAFHADGKWQCSYVYPTTHSLRGRTCECISFMTPESEGKRLWRMKNPWQLKSEAQPPRPPQDDHEPDNGRQDTLF